MIQAILILLPALVFGHPEDEDPLSLPVVASGAANLRASSVYSPSCDLSRLPLNFNANREGGQSWIPASTTIYEWVQLALPIVMRWNSVITQGRGDSDQWVTSFTVEYTLDGVEWLPYDESRVFHANFDRNSLVIHRLDPPIIARSIRVKPMTFKAHPSLRLEAYVSKLGVNYTFVPSPSPIPAIESGSGRLSASSVWDPSHDVSRISLHFAESREGSRSWCTATCDLHQWVQISTVIPKQWVKVATQGRQDSSQWVKEFYMTYTLDGKQWHQVDGGRIFTGNSDRNTVVENTFEEPFTAMTVRLHPVSWHSHISLRMEAYFYDIDN